MGNSQTKQEEIIKKCMKKGYMIYRIHNKLFIQKDKFEITVYFDGESYEKITKKIIKYLKQFLKESKTNKNGN